MRSIDATRPERDGRRNGASQHRRHRLPPRLLLVVSAILLFRLSPVLAYEPGSSIYQSTTIVTGTDLRSRPEGVRRTFLDVLIKASGDPSLAADPRLDRVEDDADAAVRHFLYEDRMSQIPMRDEQGSRDRPYDLTVGFDPASVAAGLTKLGRTVWRGDRPALLFRVFVRDRRGSYVMTADDHDAERAREALADAANRYAMLVVLAPSQGGDVPAGPQRFGVLQLPGAVTVNGELAWTESATGYVGRWDISRSGVDHRWGIRGASLDEAFRNAVAGAMKVLSGNGEPD